MSYLRPFLRSLLVSLVILVLQFLSRYKSDLFGKGLSTGTILEIFFYASISLLVLALPVAVLLSSLYAMGNFGENYELAAMRSAGMSVPRILRPMVYATILISLFSFGMSSYVVPWANLKLYHILYDIQQLKPVFRLEAGHFNGGVSDYVIRITDKDVKRDMLYGIRIYDHTHAPGDTNAIQRINRDTPEQYEIITDSSSRNNRFVYADSGTMRIDPYGKSLEMMLYSGSSYESKIEFNRFRRKAEHFVHVGFDSLFYSFDMSGYASKTTKENEFSNHQYMLNLSQIGKAIDSIQEFKGKLIKEFDTRLAAHLRIDSSFIVHDTTIDVIPPDRIILQFPKNWREKILKNAIGRVENSMRVSFLFGPKITQEEKRIRERGIEFYGKISLPLACLIFLFIGAPLGAIIRKGGAGVPIIVSVVLYLAFYVLMIQGKKLATEGVMTPFMGAWLPVMVMFPLALILSLESTAVVRIFSVDSMWHIARNVVRFLIITNPLYWIYRIPPVGRFVHWALAPIGRLFKRKESQRTFRVRR